MANRSWVLIAVGALLALSALLPRASAGEFGSPFNDGGVASKPRQPSKELAPAHVDKAASATVTPSSDAYKIGASDVLDISVFNVPELSKTVQVADTGTINLPLVGEIPAAGRTAQEVERDLTAQLGAKYLQNPQVTVYVKEYNSQRVTISGAVNKPGVYPIRSKTSLLQIIAMAEGFNPGSDSTVLVLREGGGKRSAAKFYVYEIQNGRVQAPTVQSGDVIVAGSSAIKKGFETILKVLPAAGLFALI